MNDVEKSTVDKFPIDMFIKGEGNVKTIAFKFNDGSVNGYRIAVKNVYDAIDEFTKRNESGSVTFDFP